MNGPEHYTKAERLLAEIAEFTSKTQEVENAGITMSPSMIETVRSTIALTAARAQVHATLALAAATATHPGGTDPNTNLSANEAAWAEVAEVKPS